MDIIIGKHSFNAQILKSISKEKALKSFKGIDSGTIERAWIEANPKIKKRNARSKTKK